MSDGVTDCSINGSLSSGVKKSLQSQRIGKITRQQAITNQVNMAKCVCVLFLFLNLENSVLTTTTTNHFILPT